MLLFFEAKKILGGNEYACLFLTRKQFYAFGCMCSKICYQNRHLILEFKIMEHE